MQGVYLRPIARGSSSSRCILRLEKREAFFERAVGHGASQQAKVRQQLSENLAVIDLFGNKQEVIRFLPVHMGSRSTTPLLRNPTEVRDCSQHAGANVDFGDERAVDWAFLGNLKQLRALLLG
jgi:hypothetical protein